LAAGEDRVEGTKRVSTLRQPAAANWREEVNRRLAEHKSRKGNPSTADVPAQPATAGNSRAAQAAARVAARFAKAPTYSQVQAEEARIAVRAAEIATQVALEAQNTAENRLAELHAASVEPAGPAEQAMLIPFENAARAEVAPAAEVRAQEWNWAELDRTDQALAEQVVEPVAAEPVLQVSAEPVKAVRIAEPVVEPARPTAAIPAGPVTDAKASSGQLLQIRWEPDMPAFSGQAEAEAEPFELAAEDWWTPARVANHEESMHVEAHAIQANLIEFPRELVATRRMRPRILEGIASQPEPGTQLSIFEVDPGSIETEAPAPEPVNAAWSTAEPLHAHAGVAEWGEAETAVVAAAAEKPAANVDWSTPEWNGMKLGAQVRHEVAAPALRDKLSMAPLSRRLMAGLVDTAVVGAVATFLWLTLALGMSHTLTPRVAELMGAGLIALAGLAYHAFFCFLGMPSLGMRYAGLSLCTFDEMIPTPEQMRKRFGAMVVSILPLGLGMAWSVFDEDRLAWHDRYSQTYLRGN
jgi:uncharacterized RDD family membrane protein YckC